MPADPTARERRRRNAVAGGYSLRRVPVPTATIVAVGALVPEALLAADRLNDQGHPVDVVCVTSPDLLFRALQARRGIGGAPTWILDILFPPDRQGPLVTVLDGHPHTLAFLAGVTKAAATHLGVSNFGQSGDLESVYAYHRVDASSIVAAALDLID